ncbi:ubiquinone oxidoreductase 20 kd subunit [Myxozyma melibiosi]|uniref:Ubiquinone oxidoreductase 20 kd subunit n=1 Tax=Myxozyma melibiosi TaxID=54550 RepID=A0ABR1F9B9_9ASCO
MLRLPSAAARPVASRIALLSQRRAASKVAVSTPEDAALTEDEKILSMQAPNRKETWAPSQRPRSEAMQGPRFAQHNLATQPQPYAAIDLIAQEPVRFIEENIAVCDGGRGVQGHPKVFINLDQDGPNTCTYCGLRYQMKHHH